MLQRLNFQKYLLKTVWVKQTII